MLEAPFVFAPKLSREKRLLRRVVFFPPQEARYAADVRYAMSFLMRSMASTVASASPKAVRRT